MNTESEIVMSQRLLDQLIKHEGFKSHAYKDTGGVLHIGVGRNIDEGGMGISEGEAYQLLRNDVVRVQGELSQAFDFYINLDPVRQDALCNLCFNLGLPRLKKFKLALGHLENGNFAESADEFLDSLWATQVGQRAIDVADMIRNGEYNA